jgi:hypothetical protein
MLRARNHKNAASWPRFYDRHLYRARGYFVNFENAFTTRS